jgi:glycerol-1-phosphate dehydrogenase [NAD(P)+]
MSSDPLQLVVVDDRAIEHLVNFCTTAGHRRLMLVADRNTWRAQGEAVAAALHDAGLDVKTCIFPGPEVVADANHVFQLLVAAGDGKRTFVSVGSGTITDTVRFVAHRTDGDFISVPTAPSVDAYISVGAPMIVNGVKVTFNTLAPVAVIGDIDVLMAAPRPMIAAGFGDVLAKFTSVADFRLGAIVYDEPFDPEIARRMLATAQACADSAAAIAQATREGIGVLTDALLESGQCMVDFGSSRPASGTEHHYSHYWEMKLLQEGRPAILHGAKTGVGTVLASGLYARVRALSRAEVADLLEASAQPDRDEEIAAIRTIYGELADEVLGVQRNFIEMSPERYDTLKRRILDNWDAIQAVAADVPEPERIAAWLRTAGGPGSVAELGLSAEEQHLAEQYSHYLRDRFTVRKLVRTLGLMNAA